MDRQRTLELFANTYPKAATTQPSIRAPTLGARTRLDDIVSEEGFYGTKKSIPKQAMSESAKHGTKKFLAILLIALLGALIYSAFAYTISDHIFGKMGMEFFSETGSPSTTIIAIHTLVFIGLIYFVVGAIKF